MPKFTFAAARDGDMLIGSVEAADQDAARELALTEAANYHGLNCHPDERESELDGFEIEQQGDLEAAAPAMLAALREIIEWAEPSGCSDSDPDWYLKAFALLDRFGAAKGLVGPNATDPDPDQWPGGDITGHPGFVAQP